jgi:glycosyltransferase involved in cell wall biosynthesis
MDLERHNIATSQSNSGLAPRLEPVPARTKTSATLIVNADDWGRSAHTTNRILDCIQRGVVSSTSAMVFMEDSERAAALAREHDIDAGVHLNFTATFSAPHCAAGLIEHQQKLCRFLKSNRFAPAIYNPWLAASFEYVVKTQLDEFERIYGALPSRVDGHHHMHLSANLMFQNLLPKEIILRRNLSFSLWEKGLINFLYRGAQDRMLSRRHPMADLFFDIAPLEIARLQKIISLARCFEVELESHPARAEEYKFLVEGGIDRCVADVSVARGYVLQSFPASRRVSPPKATNTSPDSNAIADIYGEEPTITRPESLPHISICICTYKRPLPLKRLLTQLNNESTHGLFTYSIVVADNDHARSAEATVAECLRDAAIPINYCVESRQGIARARNKVIANSTGEFVALIDDDELPAREWLLTLFRACKRYGVDGVLGPVKRRFEQDPPPWLKDSAICDRLINPTGTQVGWREARTVNVLLKRELFIGDSAPFRTEFKSGEDRDFFRRKIEEGRAFVWSAEAEVFEVIPPARWKRMYHVRKALLQGASASLHPDCNAVSILKSLIALPLYVVILPLTMLTGSHRFMTILVKLCHHLGKLLALAGIDPINEPYVSD